MAKPARFLAVTALAAAWLLAAAMPALAELSITRGSAISQGSPTAVANSRPTTASDWVYTLRPGDTFQTVTQDLLAAGASAAQLLQHNRLNKGSTLAVGDQLRIPLRWLKRQPEPARVTSRNGAVHLISGGNGRRTPVTPDTLIHAGDEIVTGTGSATVKLADGSAIRIAPNSRLVFNRLTQYGKSGMVDTRLRLQQGEIHTRVKPMMEEGVRFEVETPSAVAAVRGTAFALSTSAAGTSLRVTEGTVDFGVPGKTRRIPAGFSAKVSTNNNSGMSIRRLPPAPDVAPLPASLTQLPATLSWSGDDAQAFQLDIFKTDSGRWVESRQVEGSTFELNQYDNGEYEVQVAALNGRGLAGMPATQPMTVDLQAEAAELVAPEADGVADDDMPEFSWNLNGSNEVARVEVSEDDSFRELVATSEWAPETSALVSRPLSPGQYHWRVVTEAGGTSVATSEPRKLVVNGSLPPVRIINVNYVDNQVRVFWENVPTANEYLLQLAEEPGFNNIIKEATLSGTTAALRLIPGRRYFVRLKALSDGPLASRWGPGRELFLE